jgi:hypothetical protein
MILHAIDYKDRASHFLKLLSHVLVDFMFNFTVNQKIPVFGGPSSVDPNANIRVGHGENIYRKTISKKFLSPKLRPINYVLFMLLAHLFSVG